ncbi:NYN domain-containing protein [Gayadomonas joobiniege]|uniref:LabA-like NYN domain-containing protein n=1 Tax=Gayadomonas joobiniege TaxID=1234606 RepID=UPI00037FDE00|nr:NYN domain-containing protein [Gayadomonas joobiniege]
MTKIAIFADVQNIYYTCKEAYQKQFNYRAFWQNMVCQGDIVLANAYAIHKGDDGQHKFQKALKSIGFNVKLKPYIQRADGSAKGDWDVGIAIDIMETAAKVDKIVLLSGDGDFDLLLLRIRQLYQVETQVVSVPLLTANSLIEACDQYTEINADLLL